ncbi:MAG: plasmid pRiA4b ORF-3 family protein [Firmicutes bacterium]|nr:plasmid pRiA4b ORF-3 family protein [Bacillota bacterium]
MAYEIRIAICGIEPAIWRSLRIPGSITFAQLHRIIQVAFGWLDYHLYHFRFDNIVIVEPDPDFSTAELYGEDAPTLNPGGTLVSQLFDEYDKCFYEYDFGDSWTHEIVVEKRLRDTERNQVPVCLGGARHRPPEDVGGVVGYEEFLETIRDKSNPERENMLSWAQKDTRGRLFDPEYFYIDEVNRKLAYVLEDHSVSATRLLAGNTGLTGTLGFGWWEPYIEVGGKQYTWERIGDLLTWFDVGVTVTVRVSRRVRSADRHSTR